MKAAAAAGGISGCLVWGVVFFFLAGCLLPFALIVTMWTAYSPLAVRVASPFVCPKGTTGEVYSYSTMLPDENGFPEPAQAYELHCNDANGNTVKDNVIGWSLIWDGMGLAVATILTAILAFILAAPVGMLVGRLFRPKSTAAAVE